MKTKIRKEKALKLTLAIAAAVCVLGMILATCGFFSGASLLLYADAKGLHTGNAAPEYIKRAELPEVSSISIDVSDVDVEFIKAERFALDVCYYETALHPKMSISHGLLKVYEERDETYGQRYFDIDLRSTRPRGYVRVYLPEAAKLESVDVRFGYGAATLGDFAAKRLSVNGTGTIRLTNLSLGSGVIAKYAGDFSQSGMIYNYSHSQIEVTNVSAQSLSIPGGDYLSLHLDKLKTDVLNCSGRFEEEVEVWDSTIGQSEWSLQGRTIQMRNVTSSGMKLKNSTTAKCSLQGAFSGRTEIQTEGAVSFETTLKKEDCRWQAQVNQFVAPQDDSVSNPSDDGTMSTKVYGDQNGQDGENYHIMVNGVRQKGKTASQGGTGLKNQISIQAKNGSVSLSFSK